MIKSLKREIHVNINPPLLVREEHATLEHYLRFDTRKYHCPRDTHYTMHTAVKVLMFTASKFGDLS